VHPLYVALIPALLLTAILDHIGRTHGGVSYGIYDSHNNVRNFFGSAFFLQGIYTLPYGSDGPLWSLSYEFWFYMLFPLVALLLKRGARRPLVELAILVGLAFFVHGSILSLFPAWLLGVGAGLLAKVYPRPSAGLRDGAVLVSVVLLLPTIALEGAHKINPIRNQFYMDAISTLPLLWAAITAPPPRSKIYRALAIFLSEISFTLYLTHAPFLTIVRLFWLRDALWPNDARHLLLLAIPFAASILFAYALYWLFESRTDRIRTVLKKRFGRRAAVVKSATAA
jgi:peptidoglycan/LPS O-acetylase OafA/YrhL